MTDRIDTHVGADQHAVADCHRRLVEDREVEVPDKTVSDADLLPEVAAEGAVYRAPLAEMSEQPAENRLTLPAAARRQLVEREEQFLGAVQGLADRRRDGVEPSPGAHLFKVVHFCVACL